MVMTTFLSMEGGGEIDMSMKVSTPKLLPMFHTNKFIQKYDTVIMRRSAAFLPKTKPWRLLNNKF